MKPVEIISYIEKTAPLSFAADWDRSGVQVASFQPAVTHVAVMLDPSRASVEAAIAAGADFLLAHHPLAMTPRFPDRADDYLAVLSLLFRNDICLYSAHTSLDANPDGPSAWLARALGISPFSILEPVGDGHGFGFYGDLPTALSYEEFSASLKDLLGIAAWRACGPRPESVRRVACCPGSGASLLAEAESCGADVFITGDIKYHTALDTGLRIMDVGHFVLEEEMMRLFAEQMRQELDLAVSFIKSSDPLIFEGI